MLGFLGHPVEGCKDMEEHLGKETSREDNNQGCCCSNYASIFRGKTAVTRLQMTSSDIMPHVTHHVSHVVT